MTVTPKHIARDLDVPVSLVRLLLRGRFGKPDNYYWKWDDEEGAKVQAWVAKSLGKKVNGAKS